MNTRIDKWLVQYEDVMDGNALRYFKTKRTVPCLEHFASIHTVATIWYEHFTRCKQPLSTSRLGKLLIDVANYIKNLLIPETIKKKLQPYIVLIGEQIFEWMVLYDQQAFKKKNVNSVAKNYLHKIVWTRNGTIDHIKSAISMLTLDPKLFKRTTLICELCKKAVLVSPPLAFVEGDDDDDVENAGYFSFRLLKDLSNLEKKSHNFECMFCFERGISEYLKSPLNFDRENDSAIFNCLLRVDFFCALLSKCCGTFQEELFVRTESCLMGFLFQLLAQPQWIDYGLPTLYRFRNDMSVKKLSTILKRLKLVIQCSYFWATKGFSYMFDKSVLIFEEIWSFVPQQLKTGVVESHPQIFSWLWSCHRLNTLHKYFSGYDNLSEYAKITIMTSSEFRVCFARTISIEWPSFERYCIPIFFANCTNQIRNRFVTSVTENVMLECARLETWHYMEQFLKWCYKSPALRQTNTRRLLCEIFTSCCITYDAEKRYRTRAENTKEIMRFDFTLYDKLLMYYFKSERASNVFKTGELIKSTCLVSAFVHCLYAKRLDLVDVCLKWLFSRDTNRINKFKRQYRNGWLKRRIDELQKSNKRRKIE